MQGRAPPLASIPSRISTRLHHHHHQYRNPTDQRRVVNKEWEYSHKRGFKCTFDRGILHVYFNFKRTRYRR
jgi:hypothetical protein